MIKKKVKVLKNLGKEAYYNPGRAARKITAGVTKDPITGSIMLVSQAPSPIPFTGTAALALAPQIQSGSKRILSPKTMKNLRKKSAEVMSNSGQTKASKVGKGIEYHINNAALKAGNIGSILSGLL